MAVINVTPLTDITALIASDSINEGDVLLLEEGIYYQTVIITKNNIRIVAKGPKVVFDGKSTLITAFTLSNVTGVIIEGINIRQYRTIGIFIDGGSGNRIIKNTIHNTLGNGIEVFTSSGNLFWKNQLFRCFDGIRLILGSTNNWVIDNIAKECFDDGFESFFDQDMNNSFISNKAIGNTSNGLDIFGTNNLVVDNLLADNGLGLVIANGSDSVAIGNEIRECKVETYTVLTNFWNHFAGENRIVCNNLTGISNNSLFGVFLNNEISYNKDSVITLGMNSVGNLVMDNTLVCNIPENITDSGTNNIILNNTEKPCGPCEAPSEVCDSCTDEAGLEQ